MVHDSMTFTFLNVSLSKSQTWTKKAPPPQHLDGQGIPDGPRRRAPHWLPQSSQVVFFWRFLTTLHHVSSAREWTNVPTPSNPKGTQNLQKWSHHWPRLRSKIPWSPHLLQRLVLWWPLQYHHFSPQQSPDHSFGLKECTSTYSISSNQILKSRLWLMVRSSKRKAFREECGITKWLSWTSWSWDPASSLEESSQLDAIERSWDLLAPLQSF